MATSKKETLLYLLPSELETDSITNIKNIRLTNNYFTDGSLFAEAVNDRIDEFYILSFEQFKKMVKEQFKDVSQSEDELRALYYEYTASEAPNGIIPEEMVNGEMEKSGELLLNFLFKMSNLGTKMFFEKLGFHEALVNLGMEGLKIVEIEYENEEKKEDKENVSV